MSHIVLQLGQCGNQLGKDFFKYIFSDLQCENPGLLEKNNLEYIHRGLDRWFCKNDADLLSARAIMVDTEQKVTSQLNFTTAGNNKWTFNDKNLILNCNGGSANNWAVGYIETGPKVIEAVLNQIQKENEKCDDLRSFLIFCSTAGGTGSGTGTYITERLKDEFPQKSVINCVVLPYSTGEVATQDYNTLLTLSKIYDFSDAIMVFPNEYFHSINSLLMKNKKTTFHNINTLIAEQIGCFLQPFSKKSYLEDSLLHLTPHPSYKLLTLKSSPYAPTSVQEFEGPLRWESLIRSIKTKLSKPEPVIWDSKLSCQTTYAIRKGDQYYKSVANMLLCRGPGSADILNAIEDVFKTPQLYPKWVSPKENFQSLSCERRFNGKEKFATVVSNNESVTTCLNGIVEKAWTAYVHNAFVHHYYNNGLEQEELIRTFAKSECIIKDYNSL